VSDLCVTADEGHERRALPGLRLCGSCRDRLERQLGQLPQLYAQLGHNLGSTGQAGQRVSGTSSRPLPINPAVADHRDQMAHDLVSWCVYVADERGLTLPMDHLTDRRGRLRAASSPPEITAPWLARHVEWIAADLAAAEECPPSIRHLWGRARALLDPNRKLATGERCRQVDEEEQRCAGVIAFVQKPDETWEARCPLCGPQEAAPYLHDGVAGRWVTADRVKAYALRMHGVRIEADTVRQWRKRGNIKGVTEEDGTWYELGSVETYLRGRRERMAG